MRGAVLVAPSGLDEYVAESLRGFVEVNDANSPWPKATRARLAGVDPRIYAWCERIFEDEFAIECEFATSTGGSESKT